MPAAEIFKRPSARAHHIIRVIHAQMIAEGLSRYRVATGAGIGHTTLRHWWDGSRQPQLDNLEAVLNYLGLTLKATPLEPGHQKWAETVHKKPAPPVYAEDWPASKGFSSTRSVKKIKLTPRRPKA